MDGFLFTAFRCMFTCSKSFTCKNYNGFLTSENRPIYWLKIYFSNPVSTGEIEIVDQMGKVVYSQNIQNSSNHLIELDSFLSGIYFIQLIYNEYVGKPVKLVVTH